MFINTIYSPLLTKNVVQLLEQNTNIFCIPFKIHSFALVHIEMSTRFRTVSKSLYHRLRDYNVFIPDENNYDEEQEGDLTVAIKYKKYSTRL